MPSRAERARPLAGRAERVRRLAELLLRATALAALAALLWRAARPPARPPAEVARGSLAASLGRWTMWPPVESRVVLDAVPDARTRDWLRALTHAGTPIRWSASRALSATAVVAEPTANPYGATRVRLAAAGGEPILVSDAAGMIDSLPRGGATELELAAVAGAVRATSSTVAAATASRDSVALRPVLVLGAAGWEAKFTVAALEERGWRVASRMRVAPGVDVTQAPLGAIDTARYSAVIALDSTASPFASAIARYARDGGGVVLAGTSARLSALSGVAPGTVVRRVAGVAGAVTSATPRNGLGVFAIGDLRPDAVVLESRGGAVTVAARRVAAGRALQSGYDETWRWRMQGGDGAAAAHREWWSRLVAAVAYAPLVPLLPRGQSLPQAVDEAPLAALVEALGPSSVLDARLAPQRSSATTTRVLFAVVVVALLLEWSSRRLRGAR